MNILIKPIGPQEDYTKIFPNDPTGYVLNIYNNCEFNCTFCKKKSNKFFPSLYSLYVAICLRFVCQVACQECSF